MNDRSHRSRDDAPPGLAAFLVDVRTALDSAIVDARAHPDFDDAMARGGDAGASAAAPRRSADCTDDAHVDDVPPGLGQFIGDVRLLIETRAHERALEPMPALSALRSRARWLPRVMAIAIVAAAAGLAALWLAGLGTPATDDAHQAAPSAAAADRERSASEQAIPRSPAPALPARNSPRDTAEPLEIDDVQILDDVAPAPPASDDDSATPSIDALEARAADAWARGAVREAERALAQIVRKGGRSRQAELAFGDLFTIAYQRRDAPRQLALWRRYLERFPRGHYADDARAGTCRMADADTRASCWGRYLADWPRGSHRDEARKHTHDP